MVRKKKPYDNRIKVQRAKLEWKKTMERTYPGFDAKLWVKDSNYRFNHPQLAIE